MTDVARRAVFVGAMLLSLTGAALGQGVPGIQMFSTNENGVDLATGNVNIDNIQLRSKTGKIPFWSKVVATSGMSVSSNGQWQGLFWNSLAYHDPTIAGFSVSFYSEQACLYSGKQYQTADVHYPVVTDDTGAPHSFAGGSVWWKVGTGPAGTLCGNQQGTVGPFVANDGSGFVLVVTNGYPTVYSPNGDHWGGTCTTNSCNLSTTVTDPDGATISNGTDSLGTVVLNNIYGPILNQQVWYLDANGNQQNFDFGSPTQSFATNFGCVNSNGAKYPADGLPFSGSALSSLTLPTGARYTISYEPTPGMSGYYTGRVAKITLPSGGSISYAYSGGSEGINCTYQTVPTLTVTVNDANGNVSVYTYTSSLSTAPTSSLLSLPASFSVTKTDPSGNQTLYTFSGELQTEQQVYQGSIGGTPLTATITCYNGANSSQAGCISPSSTPQLPITQTDVYTSLNGGSPSLVETKYDSYGNIIDIKKYDYGATYPPSGTPLSEVQTTYNTGSNCGTLSVYIFDLPCTVVSLDSSGNTASSVKYTYVRLPANLDSQGLRV